MDVIRLAAARTRCTIAPEAGGCLLQLEVCPDGRAWLPLLLAPDDPGRALAEPMAWGSFVMAPWPNRIAAGAFTYGGARYEVRPNLDGHAAHGVVFDRPWRVEATSARGCELSIAFDARWPFGGGATQRFTLLDDGIEQRIEVRSDGRSFPAGAGWHPWFRRDVRPEAEPRVLVDAGEVYELRAMIPTGARIPVSGDTDLRTYPALGERRLDTCYRHPRGALRVRWGDLELTMASSANVRYAVVYTPARAVCVEPQTCAIDAFNLDARGLSAGVAIVEPGRPLVATTTWRWRRQEGAA
ncbi:MAG: aldose epimerase family protein [Dehalococcoidia bacterium]